MSGLGSGRILGVVSIFPYMCNRTSAEEYPNSSTGHCQNNQATDDTPNDGANVRFVIVVFVGRPTRRNCRERW